MKLYGGLYILVLIMMKKFVVMELELCLKSCDGKKHIECISSLEGFGYRCPNNTGTIDMTSLKDFIIRKHNEERNDVAGGYELNIPNAARMGEVEWSDELAYIAELSARLCAFEGKYCRQTENFTTPGHNANILHNIYDEATPETFISTIIDQWLYLQINMTEAIVRSFQFKSSRRINYYAHIVIEENNRIGCAASNWITETNDTSVLFVCFYASESLVGRRLYEPGLPGIKCISGKSKNYINLCNVSEDYGQSTESLLEII